MPNIWKRFSRPKAEAYEFPDAEDLIVEEPEPESPAPAEGPGEEAAAQEQAAPVLDTTTPIDFAQLQAEVILQDARRQAEELLEQARQNAAQEAQEVREAARQEGFQEGYAQGMTQSMEEAKRKIEESAAVQAAAVQQFIERAGAVLDRQLDDNVDDLRDLALAVAEKVVCISLKSSSEVIGRMIQVAVDKRKRREWVHVYIAECDAKRIVPIPASLTVSLSALSDRVRIIPIADDESGTCIIEMPDEIIDASASTQINNLRGLLSDAPSSGGSRTLY